MRSRPLRILLAATALISVAALLFFSGYLAGHAHNAALDRSLAGALGSVGLDRYSAQLLPPPPVISPDEIPLNAEDQDRFKVFWEAWGWVEREFYDRSAIDRQKMTQGALRGMLEVLGDPHTVYLDPIHRLVSDAELRGSFDGIGIQVDQKDGQLVVVSPIEGSPGERAGLRPGDVITHVDGKDIGGLTLLDAVVLIRGPRGTHVRLTVRRAGSSDPITLDIARDEIKLSSVRWQMRDSEIGYLRITSFTDSTPTETRTGIRELLNQHSSALILDLRNNPGGYLHASVDVASQFLKEGVVLYQQQADGERQSYPVKPGGLAATLPMVVLVNKGSASAAEIVAGALQAQGRAPLLGEPTYGKGTVQNIHTLSDNSSLRLTFARWLTPNEQPIDGKGLTPDVVVPAPDPGGDDRQLEAAARYLREHALAGNRG